MRYTEIKQALIEADIIDEVSMSPSSLEKFANSPEAADMLIGIEFEMCVPNASVDSEPEWEYDWDANSSAYDINEIINFFRDGDFSSMGRSDADRAREQLWEEYLDWTYEAANRYIDDNADELDNKIRERLEDEVSRDDASEEAHTRWVEANPDEDATSDEASAEIRDITLQIIEDRIDELMQDTSSSEYQYAYDQARQEMEDDFRSGGDGDESAWLSDIGVDDMQDAHRRWDFDWPHMYDANEGNYGDADVDTVADDFNSHTGYYARGYSGYHSANRETQQQEGYWIIEPDSSIDADSGDAGLEFISPALSLKDGLEAIKKVKAWASAAGCYTNKSTGLHMNISVPNMTIDNLDYVKLALFLGDEYVLSEFGRQYNSYAKSAMTIVKEKIQQNPENATALLAKMKEHLNAAASKLVHSGITNKYTSINTKDKYVEFRGPGGDYLDEDLTKLTNTALRLAQSLRIATDDTAYKQEYAKKLYKLIGPQGDWTDPNNSVALFSRYALGQINKSELVDNVRQAQIARKEKKGEDQQFWVMNKDGSGGKQMVFAPSSTEAIIKGGKQIGLDREKSISTLKAELFKEPAADQDQGKPEQEWTIINGLGDVAGAVQARSSDEALRIYSSTNDVDTRYYRATPAEQPTTSREEFDGLPSGWQEFLSNISTQTGAALQTMIDMVANGQAHSARDLSIEQRDAIIGTINLELRRRRSGNNDSPNAQQELEFEPDRDAAPAGDDGSSLEFDADRDTDFEIYNPETMGIVAMVRNGSLDYAVNRAREHEQFLGLPAGTLRIRPAGNSTNESIDRIRKLAGLL